MRKKDWGWTRSKSKPNKRSEDEVEVEQIWHAETINLEEVDDLRAGQEHTMYNYDEFCNPSESRNELWRNILR